MWLRTDREHETFFMTIKPFNIIPTMNHSFIYYLLFLLIKSWAYLNDIDGENFRIVFGIIQKIKLLNCENSSWA